MKAPESWENADRKRLPTHSFACETIKLTHDSRAGDGAQRERT